MMSGLFFNAVRTFSTSSVLCEVRLLSRLRVVDNSRIGRAAELAGKPARIIHVYNKTAVGKLGDRVLLAIQGQKKKGILVGLKQVQKRMIPRFDTNNVVLMEDETTPTGTRIRVPIPSCLRGKGPNFTKLLSCATKFY